MDGLAWLVGATASFVGTHLLLSHPLRPPLVRRLGERGFLGLYSLVAFATLGWMVAAARAMPAQAPLWIAPPLAWPVASLAMLLAALLLAGSLVGNPAMVDPSGTPRMPDAPRGVLAMTRHPMMWAILLWALVHAALSGTPSNLVLCAGLGGLALAGALGQDARKARQIGQPWRDWQAATSFVPFAALLAGTVRWRQALPGAIPLAGALALWLVATWLHPRLGAPVVAPWLWIG